MTAAAIALYAGYLAIAFGVRTLLLWLKTHDTGFRGISGRALTPEWWAGVLFVLALVAGLLGPVTALLGIDPVDALHRDVIQVTGAVLGVAGVLATFLAQLHMGTAWRIGVDESERTELVTNGLFRHVRNPIFTSMIVAALGLVLMVPNPVALVGLVALAAAIYLQVVIVEEPYLRRTFGDEYTRYAATAGRFLPRVRLRLA